MQEEVREWLAKKLHEIENQYHFTDWNHYGVKDSYLKDADKLLTGLKEQGVVIKKEGELNKEEFIAGYCSRSNITRDYYDRYFIALPCNCDADDCKGWATISESGVFHHLRFNSPKLTAYEELC